MAMAIIAKTITAISVELFLGIVLSAEPELLIDLAANIPFGEKNLLIIFGLVKLIFGPNFKRMVPAIVKTRYFRIRLVTGRSWLEQFLLFLEDCFKLIEKAGFEIVFNRFDNGFYSF